MDQTIVLAYVYIFFSFSVLVSSQENKVTVDNSPVYAKIGSNLTLNCQYTWVSGGEVNVIEWYKDDVKFFKQTWVVSGTAEETRWFRKYTSAIPGASNKGAFLGSTQGGPNGNAGLTIINVDTNDQGKYKCEIDVEVSRSTFKPSDEVDVEIVIEPQVPAVTFEPDKRDLFDGDTVVMTCTGNVGSPAGMLLWKRKVGEIWIIQEKPQDEFQIIETKTDGSKVGRIVYNHTFSALKNDDGAEFRCDASRQSMSQKLISSVTWVFSVKIPKPVTDNDIIAKSTDMESKDKNEFETGATIQLVCDVNAYPSADITWMKGGQTIGDGRLFTIENTQSTDSGTYTCVATNNIKGTKYEGKRDVTVTIAEIPVGGAIAGIAIAVCAVLIALIAVLMVILKRRGVVSLPRSAGNRSRRPDVKRQAHTSSQQPAGVVTYANNTVSTALPNTGRGGLDDGVMALLESLGLQAYAPAFVREKITPNSMVELTIEDLTSRLGVPLGPSRIILTKIKTMGPYERVDSNQVEDGAYLDILPPAYTSLQSDGVTYDSVTQPPVYEELTNKTECALGEYNA